MNLEYKLVNILTEQFAIIDNVYKEGIESSTKATLGYNFAEAAPLIKTSIKIELLQDEKLFLIIQTACVFEIEDESWNVIYDNSSLTVTLPKSFASFLATFTMNTTHGILHAKTEGLPVHSAVILPLTSFEEIVKEDVVIVLAK